MKKKFPPSGLKRSSDFTEEQLEVVRGFQARIESHIKIYTDDMMGEAQAALSMWDDDEFNRLWDEAI